MTRPRLNAVFFRRAIPSIGVFVAVSLCAIAGAILHHELNKQHAQESFDRLADSTSRQIAERMELYQYGLRGARGAIIGAGYDGITREKFIAYHNSRDVDVEFPGARGFGYIRRVPRIREAAFLEDARQDGMRDFAIRELAPHDRERYVIQYIEPLGRNRQAVGLDIGSEANRREAADRAMLTGKVAITAPITLVQAVGKPTQSFLILLPVYLPELPLRTPEQRKVAAIGWVYAPLVIEEVIRDLNLTDEAALAISDVDSATSQSFLFFGDEQPTGAAAFTATRTVPVFGRGWRIVFSAEPIFLTRLNQFQPSYVLGIGLMTALLAALLHYAWLIGKVRDRQIVAEQERLATIVRNSSDAIILERVDGTVRNWNKAASQIFGYAPSECIGKRTSAILWREGGERHSNIVEMVKTGISIPPFDDVVFRKDGSLVDVSITAAPVTSTEGAILGVALTIRDVSSQKAAERALQEFNIRLEHEVEERTVQLKRITHDLQTILDALPSMVGYWDKKLCNRVANRAYGDWFGEAPANLRGKHMRQLLGDELFNQNLRHVEAALRGEKQTFERALRTRDGGIRHSLAHYLPDIIDGEVRGFYVFVHDVTELYENRHKLAAALRDKESLLDTIKAHALYSEIDREGRITEVNDALCEITGYRREELIGRDHRILGQYSDHPQAEEPDLSLLKAGEGWHGDLWCLSKDGLKLWFDTIIAPFTGEEGTVSKYLSIRTDITARRAADKAMAEAAKSAEAANAAKTAFLANMSHEIRTPLNAIIGLVYLMRQTTLDGEQQSYMKKADVASRTLLGVVNDVLDLAKIEAGEYQLEEGVVNLRELVAELKSVVEPQAAERGIQLLTHFAHDAPSAVYGDSTRLRQIILNLLSNAIKFTEKGYVKLCVDPLDGAAENGIRITVEDTGIGIARNLLDRLFTPFTQADASTSRRFGGTGLGLSIVNHLAVMMGGKAGVDSELGKGSEFWVDLPLKSAVLSHSPLAERGYAAMHALLLADEDQERETGALLQSFGWGFDVHRSTDTLLEKLAEEQSVTHPEVLIVAYDVAGAAGFDMLASIRAAVEPARLPPCIVVGNPGTAATPQGLSCGCIALSTPVGASDLFNALNRALAPHGVGALRALGGDGSLSPDALQDIRILVVDDSEINCEVAEGMLIRAGARVAIANGGEEAVGYLAANPDAIDIVLMDIQMPGIDGMEATRRIRERLGLKTLPIIALTAGALSVERQRALGAGMNDFLSKPFDPNTLVALIRFHVGETSAASALKTEGESASIPSEEQPADWPVVDGISASDAAMRMGHNVRLFAQTLHRIFDEYGDLMETPAAPPATEEEKKPMAARMHKLKGNASLVGAAPIAGIAGEIETELLNPDAPQYTDVLLEKLGDALRALKAASAPVLDEVLSAPASGEGEQAEISPEAIGELTDLLRDNDIAATSLFDRLAPSLRSAVGPERMASIEAAISSLQFELALAELTRACEETPALSGQRRSA